MTGMKKAIIAVLVVFLGYWLFNDPHGLATSAKSAGNGSWEAVTTLFTKVITFLGDL
jgi:hypothetical protein